ncbi:integrase_H2C2 domain-containing protein [Nephila pilipes]|uniref:Integrase_H2C2 domain-containing protein n=1 Tax=Nephila pilipes TaxID=299642 RepID=A0A8X6T546_NEPPI|nr:integrase_H2C2 domain-containing protein [Nephila pilipes]
MIECPGSISIIINELFLRKFKPPVERETCTLINTVEFLNNINEFSSYSRMIRVVAWCKRFLHNSRHPFHPIRGTLRSSKLSQVLLGVLINVQRTSFVTKIQSLEKNVPFPIGSKLIILSPFLD